jgi:hypothetical protein
MVTLVPDSNGEDSAPTYGLRLREHNKCHNPEGAGGGQFCSLRAGVETLRLKDYDRATKTTRSVGAGASWYSFDQDAKATPVARHPFTKELAEALDKAEGWTASFAVLRDYLQPPDPPPGYTTIFRIGRKPALEGRNAANLEGLVRFIEQEGGTDFATATNFLGRTIFTYIVKILPEGEYAPQRRQGFRESNDCHNPGGSPAGGRFCSATSVGAATSMQARWGREPKGEAAYARSMLWYDFGNATFDTPSGDAEPVAVHPLADIGAALGKASYEGGSVQQAEYIDSLTPPAPPGYTKVVRIADQPGLKGSNAANPRGLTEYIDQNTDDGDLSIAWGFQLQDNPHVAIYTYYVKLPEVLGKYGGRGAGGRGNFPYGR